MFEQLESMNMENRKQALLDERAEARQRLDKVDREQRELERICGESPLGHVYQFVSWIQVCVGCGRKQPITERRPQTADH